MTLIAGFKCGNEGCIISDFRLTDGETGAQYDVAQKFTTIDNRLAIFMAGAVMLLRPIHSRLAPLMDQITHDNIDCLNNNIFVREVISVFQAIGLNHSLESDMFVVHLNGQCNNFKMFSLSMRIINDQWYCNLTPDASFQCGVIGSGSIITDSNQFRYRQFDSLEALYREVRARNYDQGTAAFAVENEIKSRLDDLGASVYSDLGIGPVFLISIINGSSMIGIGRELTGGSVDALGETSRFSYSILSDCNTAVRLTDDNTGQSIIINRTDDHFVTNSINQPVRFDPEGKENS
jgi:hypothetical protein